MFFAETAIFAVFEDLVGVKGTFAFLCCAVLLHTFQDFELAVFRPFVEMLKFIKDMPIL